MHLKIKDKVSDEVKNLIRCESSDSEKQKQNDEKAVKSLISKENIKICSYLFRDAFNKQKLTLLGKNTLTKE